MSPLNQSLLTLVEILLVVTLPIVALAAIQSLRLNSARLKSETKESDRKATGDIIKTAVAVAEQTGLVENLVGPEKKERAINVAESFLREQGINVDLNQISDLIEAEVHNLSASSMASPSTGTTTPTDRQAMIANAVETAVLAAEQSGLKGLIQNIGTEKKDYAINLATDFLKANGVNVDAELLDGLVEGQLMKLFLAARGQMPASK